MFFRYLLSFNQMARSEGSVSHPQSYQRLAFNLACGSILGRFLELKSEGLPQAVGFEQVLVCKNRSCLTVRRDGSLVQEDGSWCELFRQRQVVGCNQDRLRQFLHQFDQFAPGARVQSGGGFIKDQYLRLHREHGCDCDAFLLTAAQVIGVSVGIFCHVDCG